MNNPVTSLTLLFLLLASLPVAADSITLKDGTVLEGTIKKTSDGKLKIVNGTYEIEYKANKSGSIKDVKRVPLGDVAKIVEIRPDDIAFAELAKLVPTPDLLTAEDYATRMQAVRAFLTKFPGTLKKKDATGLLAILAEEAKAVESGGRKVDGQMVTGEEWRGNAYDLDARTVERKIRDAEKAGRSLDVLRAFAELEAGFQASASFRTMLPTVTTLMKSLRGKVAESLSTFEARMAKQTVALEGMNANDREGVKRAIDEKLATLETRYQAEKAAGQQWVTPSPDHRQSMEDCASMLDSELSRLTGELPAPPADPGKAYRDAWKAIRAGNEAEEVTKAYEAAQASGLAEKYLKLLQESAKARGFNLGGDT